MEDNHSRLTAEIENLTDLLADTRYGDKKQHPVVHATIGRIRKALKGFGKKDLVVKSVKVSEELKETVYKREIEPLVKRLWEITKRYEMPCCISVQYGDKVMHLFQPEGPGGAEPGEKMQLTMLACSAAGNVDTLLGKVTSLAKLKGHNSKALELLGVPKVPKEEKGK